MVAPALSDKELIPVLTHFWFSGDKVMAFNDQIAIEVELKTNFTGAVPGRTLLEFLEKSESSKEVKFKLTDDTLLVETGNRGTKSDPEKFVQRTHLDLKHSESGVVCWERPRHCKSDSKDPIATTH